MENNNLLIQPRMPRVVMAQNLLASPAAFDFLFPWADIVDFTGYNQIKQAAALQKYLKLYHCWEEYQKSDEDIWWLRRLPERSRRDYYLAALSENDPDLTHKLLYSGNWREQDYQTNLLIVSNPEISKPAANVKITQQHSVRYDYLISSALDSANFLVLPKDILSDLSPRIRKKTVHGLASAMYLGNHDDLHGIVSVQEEEFRAGTAALFNAMPEKFRKDVVQNAVNCLNGLREYVLYDHQYSQRSGNDREQLAFWRGAFVYVMQYLFDFDDRILDPFIKTFPNLRKKNPHQILSDIQDQLLPDYPHEIHWQPHQQESLKRIKKRVQTMEKVTKPITRVSAFLPCRQSNGETIFMPPPATRVVRPTSQP